jgi:hypothetical protein
MTENTGFAPLPEPPAPEPAQVPEPPAPEPEPAYVVVPRDQVDEYAMKGYQPGYVMLRPE